MSKLSPEIIDELLDLVDRRQDPVIRNLLPNLHPADIADLLDELDADERAYLFGLLSTETSSEVLLELDERHRGELIEEMAPREISEIVARLDSDDAADLVGELDAPIQHEVLRRLDAEDAQDVRALLSYKEDTAGGIMASEFLLLPASSTIDDVITRIRENAEDLADLHNVYVGLPGERLEGVVTLRSLLLAPRGRHLGAVATPPPITVPPDMDQEEVAHLVRQYDAVEVPVVDGRGAMLGVITFDDVVDVISEEVDEDLGWIAGTGDESPAGASVLHASGRRLPWLLVGLGGGLLSALALSRFELSLKEVVSLAFFVPVVTAMGGNAAMQSSSIAVRGLAVGHGAYRDIGRQTVKEFLVSLLNGLVCGLLLAAVVGWWLESPGMALLIGTALFAVILIATTVGALVPVVLDRLKIDPALAAGPFVTTANDVLGILVYLSLASLILPLLR